MVGPPRPGDVESRAVVDAGAHDRQADGGIDAGLEAEDLDGDVVFLASNQFYLDYTRERAPDIAFTDVKDVKQRTASS